jgi:PPOX class probable F420-dependent enzyme
MTTTTRATATSSAGSTHEPNSGGAHGLVSAITALAGLGMLLGGAWSLLAPRSFADYVDFPYHEHFLHDLGAFQLGIGATLLLALIWTDTLAVALAGFLVSNSLHAINHALDQHLGGHDTDARALGTMSILILAALVIRMHQLGWVLGAVGNATDPALKSFTRQKTAVLTTSRGDGTPVHTPVSIAVAGDHAYIRSLEKAGKTKRIRNNPNVEIAPSNAHGTPTGPALPAHARRLTGPESHTAARALRHKHPLLPRPARTPRTPTPPTPQDRQDSPLRTQPALNTDPTTSQERPLRAARPCRRAVVRSRRPVRSGTARNAESVRPLLWSRLGLFRLYWR